MYKYTCVYVSIHICTNVQMYIFNSLLFVTLDSYFLYLIFLVFIFTFHLCFSYFKIMFMRIHRIIYSSGEVYQFLNSDNVQPLIYLNKYMVLFIYATNPCRKFPINNTGFLFMTLLGNLTKEYLNQSY